MSNEEALFIVGHELDTTSRARPSGSSWSGRPAASLYFPFGLALGAGSLVKVGSLRAGRLGLLAVLLLLRKRCVVSSPVIRGYSRMQEMPDITDWKSFTVWCQFRGGRAHAFQVLGETGLVGAQSASV